MEIGKQLNISPTTARDWAKGREALINDLRGMSSE